jgi:hypothetical protein
LKDSEWVSNKRTKLKGSKRSARLWYEDIQDFKGCSATDCYRSEMGYQSPGPNRRPQFMAHNKRSKADADKLESNRKKVFVTECADASKRETSAQSKTKMEGGDAKRENQLMLWQFVNVLISDSCAPSATVTFKNCKKGAKCSCVEIASKKVNTAVPHLEVRKMNSDEQLKDKRFQDQNAAEHCAEPQFGRRSRTKTNSTATDVPSRFSDTSGIHLKVGW